MFVKIARSARSADASTQPLVLTRFSASDYYAGSVLIGFLSIS